MIQSLLFILISACTAMSCSSQDDFALAPESELELQVTKGSLQNSLLLSGTIRYAKGVSVDSPNGGWGLAIRWIVEDGTNVKKGDKVLVMDTTEVAKQIDSSATQLTSARQALIQIKQEGNIKVADKEHQVNLKESALANAVLDAEVPKENFPRRVYEDRQRAKTRAEAELEGARQALLAERRASAINVKEKKIAVEKTERLANSFQERLSTHIIAAPTAGLVVVSRNRRADRPFQIDDKTWPGQTILEFPELDSVIVEAELSDVDDGQVYQGMAVSCILDAYPNLTIPGHVTSVSPVAQAPTKRSLRRSFEVQIALDEKYPDKFRSGMSVLIEAKGLSTENVLLIPRQALAFSSTETLALLASGGHVPVELGSCSVDKCIVSSGIDEGTRLRQGVLNE